MFQVVPIWISNCDMILTYFNFVVYASFNDKEQNELFVQFGILLNEVQSWKLATRQLSRGKTNRSRM